MKKSRNLVALVTFLPLAMFTAAIAQPVGLVRLNEALAHEKKGDLRSAQLAYQGLVNDAEWGAAAQLGLARVLRWQYAHDQALLNYQAVLRHAMATPGMRDEASLGIAQIDTADMRLASAWQRLSEIGDRSPVSDQVRLLQGQILATNPTRVSASYGQVRAKGGASDDSLRLVVSHQLDLRQSISLSYANNSLVQRSADPNTALDFVNRQSQVAWRYQVPLGVAYGTQATFRQLNSGSEETSLRFDGSWPIQSKWRSHASTEVQKSRATTYTNGSIGLSTKLRENWQLGATIYVAETSLGQTTSWMANATYESGSLLAQWFASRTLGDAKMTNTLVIRKRLNAGPTWRAELKRDGAGNTFTLGLNLPWGKHMSSAFAQSSPLADQFSVGFEYAIPNGLEGAVAVQSK